MNTVLDDLFENGRIGLRTYYLAPSNFKGNLYRNKTEEELEVADKEYLERVSRND